MPQFIQLTGVTFNNPDLPILNDLSEGISELPNLTTWVNAGEGNIFYDQSGDLVLLDKSPASVNFIKAPTRDYGPSIKKNGLNGHNTIIFEGNGSSVGGLKREVDDMPINQGSFTYAMVVKVTGNAGVNNNLIATGNLGTSGVPMFSSSTASTFSMSGVDANASHTVSSGMNKWFILIGSFNNDTNEAKLLNPENLETVTTSIGSSPNVQPALFLGQNDSLTSLAQCEMAEVIVLHDDVLSNTNSVHLSNIIDYFKSKYLI